MEDLLCELGRNTRDLVATTCKTIAPSYRCELRRKLDPTRIAPLLRLQKLGR